MGLYVIFIVLHETRLVPGIKYSVESLDKLDPRDPEMTKAQGTNGLYYIVACH